MVYAQFEGAEASQLNAATRGNDSVSSRMFAEVGNYQVAEQTVSSTRGSNYSAEKSAVKKDIEKMLNQFGIDDAQQQKPKPIDPGHCPPWMTPGKPDKHPDKPSLTEVKPDKYPDKHPDKYPDKPGGKPWNPELGVCAPGSPYKINCFDDKDSKLRTK